MHQYGDVMDQAVSPSERRVLDKFLQAPAHAPQSGEIFGILKNMKETFQANLEQMQKDEGGNQVMLLKLNAVLENAGKASK